MGNPDPRGALPALTRAVTWPYFLHYTTLLETCQVTAVAALAPRWAQSIHGYEDRPQTPPREHDGGSQGFAHGHLVTRGRLPSVTLSCESAMLIG
jgi:hypothetical protein